MDELEVPSRLPQILLFVFVVVAFIAVQALSPLPEMPMKRPWIDPVADLPKAADQEKYRIYVYSSTAMLPTGRRLTVPDLYKARDATPDGGDQPVRLGHAIDEWVALGMPFGAKTTYGAVLYIDHGSTMSLAPLDDDQLKLLRQEVGAPVGEGFSFAWWAHLWGWIPLLALLGGIALEVRRAIRVRQASGIL